MATPWKTVRPPRLEDAGLENTALSASEIEVKKLYFAFKHVTFFS